jgi:hypothetical protein
VKQRAKSHLLGGTDSLHTDDLLDVDDCLDIAQVDGLHVHLEPTGGATPPLVPNNGYHVIPEGVVAAYAAKRGLLLD